MAAQAARSEASECQAEALRSHLAGCAECRRQAAAAEQLDGALRASLSRPAPAIDLRPEVMRRISAARATARWPTQRRWLPAATGLAAAAFAAGLFGWWQLRPTTPGIRPETVGPQLPAVARLASASGSILIASPGGAARSGVDGMEIREGDRLQTQPDASAQITLPDGTAVQLGKDTAVRMARAGMSLDAGRLLADVKPQLRAFVVTTPAAQAQVLGTAFTVEARPSGSTIVTVARGAVRVANRLGNTVVPAGSFTVAREGIPPLPPEAIDTTALPDWSEPGGGVQSGGDVFELAAEMDAARRAVAGQRQQLRTLRKELQKLQAVSQFPNFPVSHSWKDTR
jgi:hypothetical protein